MDTESSPGRLRKWMMFLGAALVPPASWLVVGFAVERWALEIPFWLVPFLVFGPGFVLLVIRYWHSPRLGSYAGLVVSGFLFGYLTTGILGFLLLLRMLGGLAD